ncbi:MAG: penicillin-binding transpeptidase domain-containing protein [Chloroflexota bacterium]
MKRNKEFIETYNRGREREKRLGQRKRRSFLPHIVGTFLVVLLILVFLLFDGSSTSMEDSLLESTVIAEPLAAALPTETPISTNTPSPLIAQAALVEAYYVAWNLQDYVTMYSLLTPQSQAQISEEAFIERYQSVAETALLSSVSSRIISSQVSGTRLLYEVEVDWITELLPVISKDHVVELSQANGRWGILWSDRLILPELVSGDRLTFETSISERGTIYDRNGIELAAVGERVTVGIIPGQQGEGSTLIGDLSSALDIPREEIDALLVGAQPDWFVPVADLRREEYESIADTLEGYLDGNGLRADFRTTRLYAPRASHLLGYLGAIPEGQVDLYAEKGYPVDELIGLAGLEAWGEPYLRQIGGRLLILTPENGLKSIVAEQIPAAPAELYTTFDLDFQAAVEEALEIGVTSHPTSTAGSAVVIDVTSGHILASASYPAYNPEIFDNRRPYAAQEINLLINDSGNPLLNRVTQGTYPPGSIFKIVTVAAAINSGKYTFDTLYESTGSWNKLGESFVKYDWLEGGHGTINLAEALVVSCNTCFYDVGYQIDQDTPDFLSDVARDFGLGEPTGLVELIDQPGLIPDPEWKETQTEDGEWVSGDAVNMAIGQGYVTVTPLQMAQMAAAMANDGVLLPPKLIDRVVFDGQTLTLHNGIPLPEWERQIDESNNQLPIDPETMKIIQDAMLDVSVGENGTANLVFGENFEVPVAGKTGTAENPGGDAHAWFIGYTPAEPYRSPSGVESNQPKLAIAVLMENGGSGADFAAPIFREIVARYYQLPSTLPYPWAEEE